MPVVVSNEHVHLSRGQQRAHVNGPRAGVDSLEQCIAADYLVGARERGAFLRNVGMLLELAQHSRKLASEFAKSRIVWHHHCRRRRMKNAERGLDRRSGDRAQWMRRAPLVANNVEDDRMIELWAEEAESLLY